MHLFKRFDHVCIFLFLLHRSDICTEGFPGRCNRRQFRENLGLDFHDIGCCSTKCQFPCKFPQTKHIRIFYNVPKTLHYRSLTSKQPHVLVCSKPIRVEKNLKELFLSFLFCFFLSQKKNLTIFFNFLFFFVLNALFF